MFEKTNKLLNVLNDFNIRVDLYTENTDTSVNFYNRNTNSFLQ